jgi:hypothetical protein
MSSNWWEDVEMVLSIILQSRTVDNFCDISRYKAN